MANINTTTSKPKITKRKTKFPWELLVAGAAAGLMAGAKRSNNSIDTKFDVPTFLIMALWFHKR